MLEILVTANERALVKAYREIVGDQDYAIPAETLEDIKGLLMVAMSKSVGGGS
jgi:hypothetical protein